MKFCPHFHFTLPISKCASKQTGYAAVQGIDDHILHSQIGLSQVISFTEPAYPHTVERHCKTQVAVTLGRPEGFGLYLDAFVLTLGSYLISANLSFLRQQKISTSSCV